MAVRTFYPTWSAEYYASGGHIRSNPPSLRVGSTPGYTAVLGFDSDAILEAINTAFTQPKITLYIYSMDSAFYNIAAHKHETNEASWIPPFKSLGIEQWKGTNVWASFDLTGTFDVELTRGYKGITIRQPDQNNLGEFYSQTHSTLAPYIEVEAEWNEPPSIPQLTYPRGNETFYNSFTARANPSTDTHQSGSEILYQWAYIVDGQRYEQAWSNALEMTFNGRDFHSTDKTVQVAIRSNDGYVSSDWNYSNLFTVRIDSAPTQPVILQPDNLEKVNATDGRVPFEWYHQDDGKQTSFQIRYRYRGAFTWTMLPKQTQSIGYYVSRDIPQGIIEWQVRTYDEANQASPWSAIAVFQNVPQASQPRITNLTDHGVSNNPLIEVEWEVAEQDNYIIEIYMKDVYGVDQLIFSEDGRILDEILGTNRASTTRKVLAEYRAQHRDEFRVELQIEVDDKYPPDPLIVNFTVEYLPPEQPTLQANPRTEDGAIELVLRENNSSGHVGLRSMELWKRKSQSNERFQFIARTTLPVWQYVDYDVAQNTEYDYYINGVDEDQKQVTSEIVKISVDFNETFLHRSQDLTDFVKLQYNPTRTLNHTMNRTLHQFSGRFYPTAEYGINETMSGSISFSLFSREAVEELKSLIQRKEVLLYRDTRGRKEYISISAFDITDNIPEGYTVSITFDTVEFN